jgi:hypothetical protein
MVTNIAHKLNKDTLYEIKSFGNDYYKDYYKDYYIIYNR